MRILWMRKEQGGVEGGWGRDLFGYQFPLNLFAFNGEIFI